MRRTAHDSAAFVRLYRRAILAGQAVAVHDPPPRWPFIAIDDCARAIERLDAAAFAARYANAPLGAEYVAADMAHSDARLRALGFAPAYASVREGLSAMLAG